MAEAAIVMPFVLLFTFALIQGAFYYLGREVAQSAAHQGALAASVPGTTQSQAVAAARETLTAGAFSATDVRAAVTGQTVTVTVTGNIVTLVPGLNWSTTQTAVAGVERFTTPADS